MNIEEAKSILKDLVYYPEYKFIAMIDGRGEMFLQAMYFEEDIYTKEDVGQFTRRWFISPEMSKSELVQTAFKCVMTSMEHRVREHFLYSGRRVFGPHFDIDDLYEAAGKTEDKRNVE